MSAEPFVIVMPPPNVTGALHIGHALNNTLQDVLIRYQRRCGRDAVWVPGTDHAGIAAQNVVERALATEGLSRAGLGRAAFHERMLQQKDRSSTAIRAQWQKLALSPNLDRERFTLDAAFHQEVIDMFVRLHRDGLIYRDKRLVNYDTALRTVVSDLEVQQKPINGHLYHIRYLFNDAADATDGIIVATTRPETMFGDMAIIVHPDDDRYQSAVGRSVRIPLTGREIPVLADAAADPETGTGAVKITPAHDFNDFEIGRRHGLAMLGIFNEDGTLNDAVPPQYRGLDRFAVRKLLQSDLGEALVETKPHSHNVPHGDRSGTVLEPMLTDQWYVNAQVLAQPAIAAVEAGRTRFVPELYTETYFRWMRDIKPWCISRQLWWGHRIPAWHAPDGQIFVAHDAAEAQAAATAKGIDPNTLQQDPDVLDTWFSSGLWAHAVFADAADRKRYTPTDVLVTGADIIFFWVARMMMMTLYATDNAKVPFKTVVVHALVRDEHGQKMSKSKGNVVDPLAIVDDFGADVLRFTLAYRAVPGRDLKLAMRDIETVRNFTTKIRNAARFVALNTTLADGVLAVPATSAIDDPINAAMLYQTAQAARHLSQALEAFRFDEAARALMRFIRNEFCDRYVEYAKALLQNPSTAATTRAVLRAVMRDILRMIEAFMPQLAAELATELGIDASGFPNKAMNLDAQPAAEETAALGALIDAVRALRAELNVPAGQKPVLLCLQLPLFVQRHSALIERLARLTRIEAVAAFPAGCARLAVGVDLFALPLEGVDTAAEKIRLQSEIAVLETHITAAEQRLNNPGFVAKAREEVIDDTRAQLEDNRLRRDRLAETVAML